MNKLYRALVDACRRLEIRRTPDENEGAARRVSIGVPRSIFPDRLYDVSVCLEDLDRSEAYLHDHTPDALTRMRMALDGIMAWMRVQGIDTVQPTMIAGIAMGNAAPSGLSPEVRRQVAAALKASRGDSVDLGSATPITIERRRRVKMA